MRRRAASKRALLEQARGSTRPLGLLGLALVLLLSAPSVGRAQTVDNTAFANYTVGGTPVSIPSNTFIIALAGVRTAATLELWRYAPGAAGATPVPIVAAECSASGAPAGPFGPAPGPNPLTGPPPIGLGVLDMLSGTQYALGEAAFLRILDADQNANPGVVETVLVSVSASGTGDSVLVRLSETGPNTGEFSGWVQTASVPSMPADCLLTAQRDGTITATYTDATDPSDVESLNADIRPLSLTLDAAAGTPVSGVTIRLVEEPAGIDASPLGDDGISPFPATITSGGTTTDGVTTYVFAPGTYRYPYVPAGTYRLEVTPPPGYVFPSATPTATIQSLPGAPFSIVTGSRGELFTLAAPTAIDIDVPLDPTTPQLFLSITSNKDVVGVGDLLQYDVRVRNPGAATAPTGLSLDVVLPRVFRYRAGTSTLDGAAVPDPIISADGRTLTYALPATPLAALVNVRFQTDVTTGTPLGEAVATAQSVVNATLESHSARDVVLVQEELFSDATFVMGQVALGACDPRDRSSLEGVAGVRVYLEDGTYAVTDENGLYHFEGLDPGVHVVQVDTDSVPAHLEVEPCMQNTRFAGRGFSQFVDMQGGALWRSDFDVKRRPPATGYVNHWLDARIEDEQIRYTVEVRGSGVPVRGLASVVMLPEGVHYEPGSSRLDGEPIADPEQAGRAITHRVRTDEGRWARELEFRARISSRTPRAEPLVSKAFASFRTPTQDRQRTPIATASGLRASRVSSGLQSVDTVGLVPGEEWETVAAGEVPAAMESPPSYDKAWLERATAELQWLLPGPEFSPTSPSVNLAIAHRADLGLEIELNGETVPAFHLDERIVDSAKTKAISRFRGVDVIEGPNHFEVIARDRDGRVVDHLAHELHYPGPAIEAVLVPEASHLVADGKNPIVVAVRFSDRWGRPAREGTIGAFSVEGGYMPQQERDAFDTRPLAGLAPERPEYTVERDGMARIELAPSPESGRATLHIPLGLDRLEELDVWIEPEARDWVLVGLTEGTLAHSKLSGNMESLDELDVEDHWDHEGRTSLFAKGRIRGEWLLTVAYDSRRGDGGEPEALGQQIDPDKYYTLYGSRNEQDYAAPSSSKLYLKLERSKFYALFGDYDTGMTMTELARYSRSFTGFKSEYDGDSLGFSSFAAKTDQGFLRDELRGDGTSGLYRLTRESLVVNSEKVTIETRDRFRTEVVLSSETLTRHTDYDIDYSGGTLFFRRPVPSRTGFDPVFIVVEYEAEDDRDRSMVAGARGAVKFLDDRLELGVSGIHEGNTGQDGELFAADFRYDFDRNTTLRAEAGWSNTDVLSADREGTAYLVDLTTQGDRLSARAYAREQEGEFGLGHQSSTETATRKLGADARYQLTDAISVDAEAYRQTNLETETDRDVVEGRLEYQLDQYSFYSGFLRANDRSDTGPDQLSQLFKAGGSYRMFDEKLNLRLDSELALGGDDDENVDHPSRVILGADYQLHPKVAAFAEHEFGWGDNEDTFGTRAGLRTTPWTGAKADASMERKFAENGERLFANLGLRQSYKAGDRWSFDASLDRTATLRSRPRILFHDSVPPTSGTLDDDFTAISLGSTYQADSWSWTTRVEERFGEQDDRFGIFTGVHQELSEGLAYSVGLELFSTRSQSDDDTRNGRLDLSLVRRPLGSRWILLNRSELHFETGDGSFDFDSRKILNNLKLNYLWSKRLQISLQYGAKYLLDQIDDEDLRGFIDVWGVELRRDLGDHWDISAHGRVRHSREAEAYDSAYGLSLGRKVTTNLWMSLGYNFSGFRDEDFGASDYTARGPFLSFRYKFDQVTVEELINRE